MAKVLVVGASRGIGLETVRAALRAGHRVRALARSAARMPIQHANFDTVSGDALDRDTIRDALQDVEVVIPNARRQFRAQVDLRRYNALLGFHAHPDRRHEGCRREAGRPFSGLVVDDKDAVRKALAEAGIPPLPGPFLTFSIRGAIASRLSATTTFNSPRRRTCCAAWG